MYVQPFNPPPPPPGGPSDRLSMALVVALVLHATVILGIGFQQLQNFPEETPTLEITLVQTRTEEAPKDPDYLAQASHLGGGKAVKPARPTSPATTPAPSPKPTAAAPPPPARAPQPPKEKVVSTPKPSSHRVTSVLPRPAPPDQPRPNAGKLIAHSLEVASLTAELDQQRDAYARRERVHTISASTRESRFALYMDEWRRKVERIGNLNYPDEAKRRGISGSLRLLVRIERDGSVRDVELRQSSGYKVLDDAAIRIVNLAAPFAPLPANIARDTDVLEIIRTWVFRSDNRLTSR